MSPSATEHCQMVCVCVYTLFSLFAWSLPLPLSLTHTHTHSLTYTCAHAHTYTHAHCITVPSAAPYNIMATEVTTRTLTLTWTAPDESQWNGIISHYVIDVLQHAVYNTSSDSTRYTVTGLKPYTTYEITVAVFTIAAGPSNHIIVTTEEDSEYDSTLLILMHVCEYVYAPSSR